MTMLARSRERQRVDIRPLASARGYVFVRLFLFATLAFWSACQHRPAIALPAVQEGDILFQSLRHDPLVDTIEGATHSPYSHCGIVHQTPAGPWVVIEAIGPVKETPLAQWVSQARDGRCSIYRLREGYRDRIPSIIAAARTFLGRPYDIRYELDDEKIYCSELIFKAFKRVTGEDLGRLQTLGELDWQPYQAVIESIEGGPVPLDRTMITPRSLSEAPQLIAIRVDK